MVTKLWQDEKENDESSVLAKIFMVTKHTGLHVQLPHGSVLAKIFMVTKHYLFTKYTNNGSVLAKIFMVTKLDD